MTGQRFGRLTVVERAGSIDSFAAWKCRCDCGNEVVVASSQLRKGLVKSCGCLQRQKGHEQIAKMRSLLFETEQTSISPRKRRKAPSGYAASAGTTAQRNLMRPSSLSAAKRCSGKPSRHSTRRLRRAKKPRNCTSSRFRRSGRLRTKGAEKNLGTEKKRAKKENSHKKSRWHAFLRPAAEFYCILPLNR